MTEFIEKLRKLPRFTSPRGVIFPADDGELVEVGSVISLFISVVTIHIESLQKKLQTCKESWDEQEEQIRSLEHALSLANDDSKDSHYTWIPYAENHLESLSMPVLIEADWIRQLIYLGRKDIQDQYDGLDDHSEKLLQRNNSMKFELESLQKENEQLRQIMSKLPDKIMQLDSWADTEELNFPIPDATEDEQLEWFDKFCDMQAVYIRGCFESAMDDLQEVKTLPNEGQVFGNDCQNGKCDI